MTPEQIESGKQELIELHGEWTAHNIKLAAASTQSTTASPATK